MKKRNVTRKTLLNTKGILIIAAFGIWVNLLMSIDKPIETFESFLFEAGPLSIGIVFLLYLLFMALDLFFEVDSTD